MSPAASQNKYFMPLPLSRPGHGAVPGLSRPRASRLGVARRVSAPWARGLLVRKGLLRERVIRTEDQRGVDVFCRLLLLRQLRTRRGVEDMDRCVSAAAGGHRGHRGRVALGVRDPQLEVVIFEELNVDNRCGIVMHPGGFLTRTRTLARTRARCTP